MVERYKFGKAVPQKIMRRFRIDEISAVDRPAQKGARMTIMKRDSGVDSLSQRITKKYIDPIDGAVSFSDVMRNSLDSDRYCEIMKEVGPAICALETSLRSIAGDGDLDETTKEAMMQNSTDQFFSVIRTRWPDVETAISDGLDEGVQEEDDYDPNDPLMKQIAELTAKCDTLNLGIVTLKTRKLKERLDQMNTEAQL